MPGARFVHVLRDGRDVVASLVDGWLRTAPGHDRDTYLTAAAARWCHDVSHALSARDEPGYLEVRYEELVRDPGATVDTILAHCGRQPLDPQAELSPTAFRPMPVFAPRARADSRTAGRATSPTDVVSQAAVGRYERDLAPRDLETLERFRIVAPAPCGQTHEYAFAPLMAELGYATATA
jgi:hypothetical protein